MHASATSVTRPDEQTTGFTVASAQSSLAPSTRQSGMSATMGESKAENATTVEYETVVTAGSRRMSTVLSTMGSVRHPPLFLEGYTMYLFVLFITMLVLNVLTVVYMYFENQGLALSMDKESVLRHPLVCVHRCSPQLAAFMHRYPQDGLCDFLYLQLPAGLSLAHVRTAPCYDKFRTISSVGAVTRHGVLFDRSQSNASYWQLKGDEGMVAFVALWGNRIKNHGLTNFVLNKSTSANELKLCLPLIERLRELQALLNELTGEEVARRYMMLDVRTSYTNPTADLVILSKLLRIVMTFPIDLLLLQTHLPADGAKPCMVVGPTTSVRAGTLDAVEVPIMSETMVMASRAEPPDYVTVLLSFSARTLSFDVPQSWSLGMPCDNITEPKQFSEVCYDQLLITNAGWEMSWFQTSSRYKTHVVTFDDNSTVGPKMMHAYKLYSGKRLGWAVDDVEFDIGPKDCRKAVPLVWLVARGRPGRIPQLP
ncbi:uncharacterized protein [Dermacentor andersoni]|uniref:uncharacterized protein n=1 Tax=Dermacentor andersoni TaxID=34620 RepID=UPI0024160894|nr:uncharacterized protein LOC126528059 [Dermacentor andersoni]